MLVTDGYSDMAYSDRHVSNPMSYDAFFVVFWVEIIMERNMYRSVWVFLLSFGLTLSIDSRAFPIETHSIPAIHHEREVINIVGKIVFVRLEGGFWGIVAEDGQRYDPRGLDPLFQKEGISVRVKARRSDRVVQIHMWGMPIEILEIHGINGEPGRPEP